MKFWIRILPGAVVGAIVGLMIESPVARSAQWRRVHATVCSPQSDDYADWEYRNGEWNGFDTNHSGVVRCQVPSDTKFWHDTVVGLNVHGYSSGSGANFSRACISEWDTAGVVCGTNAYWGSGYGGVYGVDVSPWQDSNHHYWYPYLYNSLGTTGSIHGFYITQ